MFRPAQVLQALKSIIWSSNSIYASSPGMRGAAEAAVKDHYENQQLEERYEMENHDKPMLLSNRHGWV